MSSRMVEVEDCDVPVVSKDYLEEAGKGAALLKIPAYTISDWGAPRHSLPSSEYTDGGKSFKSQGEWEDKKHVLIAARRCPSF